MKRFLCLILCISLMFLASCAGGGTDSDNTSIVASFYPVYIFTLNLTEGIEGVSVSNMSEQNTSGCLHDYQITTKDMKLISGADLFVMNGAGMEDGFMSKILEQFPALKTADSSKNIPLLVGYHDDSASPADSDSHANPHIWMSIDNAVIQVNNISEALAELLPENADKIEANRAAYITKLSALKAELKPHSERLASKPIITFHEAYDYLAAEFSLNVIESIESDEGGDPTTAKLAELSNTIRENGVTALFVEPSYSGSAAGILASETGVKVYTLNPITSGEKALTAYEDIMRSNFNILTEAIG
ncbi:MAG: zinc ABC transporter substrate-binding protein [Clostridiales bacterium]|nr:zinc ABC transporter substrate-binding protein [Clostridiales bacterium]